MPPKIKVSDEEILETAIQITREKGWNFINARELAKEIGCSTQPIFRAFKNMEELKKSLYEKTEVIYNKYMINGINHSNPFLGVGLAYIDFAKKESNLFKLLFMSDSIKVKSVFEMIEGEENQEIVDMLIKMTGLNKDNSKKLYVDIWLVTHGIASMIATNSCVFDDHEIETIIRDAFTGFVYRLSQNQKEN